MWCQGMNCVSFCWEGFFFCNLLTFRANKHCQYYPLNLVWKLTSYKLFSKQILYVRSKGKFHTNPNQKFKFSEHVSENSNDQWTAPPGIVHWGINNNYTSAQGARVILCYDLLGNIFSNDIQVFCTLIL